MALCHLGAIEVQQVIVGEHLHAVVPGGEREVWMSVSGEFAPASDGPTGHSPPGTSRAEQRGGEVVVEGKTVQWTGHYEMGIGQKFRNRRRFHGLWRGQHTFESLSFFIC